MVWPHVHVVDDDGAPGAVAARSAVGPAPGPFGVGVQAFVAAPVQRPPVLLKAHGVVQEVSGFVQVDVGGGVFEGPVDGDGDARGVGGAGGEGERGGERGKV